MFTIHSNMKDVHRDVQAPGNESEYRPTMCFTICLFICPRDSSEDQARFAQAADGCGAFPRGNADDERVDEVGQPPLPAITGGTLCSSNGPL